MRALISVFDKTGIVDFAEKLSSLGVEIISSGGTYNTLKQNGVSVKAVEDITGFKECLGGRIKTLHPNIHAGILANRNVPEDMEAIASLEISPIDIVVVNLYPFEKIVSNPKHTLEDAIENIDIGGPTLIRAAAKNHSAVSIITDISDYNQFLKRYQNDDISSEYRFSLAKKAFQLTACYDQAIANYLLESKPCSKNKIEYPEVIKLSLDKKQDLRYGENPHQTAAYYIDRNSSYKGIESAILLNGKELSYNNITDAHAAITLTMEFSEPACVAVKHSTPCGVAVCDEIASAYKKAYNCDPISIFGGVICVNREVEILSAKMMHETFLEVIIAPSFSDQAFQLLSQKKNLRILELSSLKKTEALPRYEYKSIGGGFLVQKSDIQMTDNVLKTVTIAQPSASEMDDMLFAFKVVKHVKSNAIVIAKNGATLGIGGGEVSRIWATDAALNRAGGKTKNAILASDAFFPFADVVESCAKHGIASIIQPGGSKNDQLSIDECNKHGIAMIFTDIRHFKH